MIPRLDQDPAAPFPSADEALDEPDGLLAWGGDLSARRLLSAYGQGIFPWYSDSDPILWWCPAARCVLRTNHVHVSRSLGRTLRQGRYRVTADLAFEEVIAACTEARSSTWITPEMKRAYRALFRLGFAHSIEVWDGEELAGGLYGVSLGRVFFGESMFSRETDTSKVALVTLCRVLSHWGFPLVDCQVENPHLSSMGAEIMAREEFLGQLRSLSSIGGRQGSWSQSFEETLGGIDSGN